MSLNYSFALRPHNYKGVLGLQERFDESSEINEKVLKLANLIRNSRHIVVYTGI